MRIGSIAGGVVKGRLQSQGRIAVGLAATATAIRVYRRLIRRSQRPTIRFAVKPGEVYEIRGIQRTR